MKPDAWESLVSAWVVILASSVTLFQVFFLQSVDFVTATLIGIILVCAVVSSLESVEGVRGFTFRRRALQAAPEAVALKRELESVEDQEAVNSERRPRTRTRSGANELVEGARTSSLLLYQRVEPIAIRRVAQSLGLSEDGLKIGARWPGVRAIFDALHEGNVLTAIEIKLVRGSASAMLVHTIPRILYEVGEIRLVSKRPVRLALGLALIAPAETLTETHREVQRLLRRFERPMLDGELKVQLFQFDQEGNFIRDLSLQDSGDNDPSRQG